jgi:RNA polymerase-interacting CarD/CdnL/TRCF family regulator
MEDQRLLDHGRQLLIQEMALAMKDEDQEAEQIINTALDEACTQDA